jgi:outer membrane protein
MKPSVKVLSGSWLSSERAKSRFVAMVVALMLGVFAPRVYAQVRIAVIDMQRAMLDTQEGHRVKNQLKKLFDSRQEQLNHRQDALKRMKDDIEKQKTVVSQQALQKRVDEYQKAFVELQQSFSEYQQELAQKEAALTKEILVNMQTVVRSIGTAEGFTVIIDSSAVMWAPTHLDITDRAITEYNQTHPASATATDPPAGDAGAAPAAPATPTRPARPTTPVASPHPRTPANE